MTVLSTNLPSDLKGHLTGQSHDHPEREQVWALINRAYQNLYGASLPAQPDYQKIIFEAALALHKDPRSADFSERTFLHLCEDIIRISDEHRRLARTHQTRASNPVYLRETALDNALEQQKYLSAISAAKPQNAAVKVGAPAGRIHEHDPEPISSSEVMELAYQQLCTSIERHKG